MDTIQTNWTRPEFKAYLLSYCAQANFFECEEEREEIMKVVSIDQYRAVHKELARDNDYQSIQKILFNLEKYHYSHVELNRLMDDIQSLFLADGTIDLLETNMLTSLKRLVY